MGKNKICMLKKASIHSYDYLLLILAALLPASKKDLNYFLDVDYPAIGTYVPISLVIMFLVLIIVGAFKAHLADYILYGLRIICISVVILKVLLYILY